MINLDAKALYPHLYAETHRHRIALSVPVQSSTGLDKPPSRRIRSTQANTTTCERRKSAKDGPRPKTPVLTKVVSNQQSEAAAASNDNRLNDQGLVSRIPLSAANARSNLLEDPSCGCWYDGEDPTIVRLGAIPSSRTSRQVAIRGESAIDAIPIQAKDDQPLTAKAIVSPGSGYDARAATPLTTERLTARDIVTPGPELQDMVQNARPRTRYARRENSRLAARFLERISTPPLLSSGRPLSSSQSATGIGFRSTNTPLLSSRKSMSSLLDTAEPRPENPLIAPPLVSWAESNVSSFFLTEINARVAADQWKIVHGIARGSYLLYGTCDFSQAAAYFSSALAVAQDNEDDLGLLALIHHHIGIALKEQGGKLNWAKSMQEKALTFAERLQDRRMIGRALKALGVILLEQQQYDAALEHQQRALAIAIEEKDQELEARVYANLGNLASSQSHFGHALVCHERDLKLCLSGRLRSAMGQARAHHNLAILYDQLNKQELKREHEQKAALLSGPRAFEVDVANHANDAAGNVYMQLTFPDPKLAEMVAAALQDVLEDRSKAQQRQLQTFEVAIPTSIGVSAMKNQRQVHLKPKIKPKQRNKDELLY